MQIRIQKILASHGISSRRKGEELIQEGLVTVNGKVAILGQKADPTSDAIKCKGKLLPKTNPTPALYQFYKPRGVLGVFDESDASRRNLFDYFSSAKLPLWPLQSLDYAAEGIMVLSADPSLAEKWRRKNEPRTYRFKLKGNVTEVGLAKIKKAARLDGLWVDILDAKVLAPTKSNTWIELSAKGPVAYPWNDFFIRKGYSLERVRLVAMGPFSLGRLLPGQFEKVPSYSKVAF